MSFDHVISTFLIINDIKNTCPTHMHAKGHMTFFRYWAYNLICMKFLSFRKIKISYFMVTI